MCDELSLFSIDLTLISLNLVRFVRIVMIQPLFVSIWCDLTLFSLDLAQAWFDLEVCSTCFCPDLCFGHGLWVVCWFPAPYGFRCACFWFSFCLSLYRRSLSAPTFLDASFDCGALPNQSVWFSSLSTLFRVVRLLLLFVKIASSCLAVFIWLWLLQKLSPCCFDYYYF